MDATDERYEWAAEYVWLQTEADRLEDAGGTHAADNRRAEAASIRRAMDGRFGEDATDRAIDAAWSAFHATERLIRKMNGE